MRFLVDQCTGPAVARWLREQGHEVFSVFDEAQGLPDNAILDKAFAEDWIIVTNDKDFGDLIFRDARKHKGIVLLRLDDERTVSKIAALQRLLEAHAADLPGHFAVVRETLIRVVPG